MRFEKPATSIDEQAQLLLERGLVCEDRELVSLWLRTVGYYRLSAYWLPYEEPAPKGRTRSKTFKAGTRFEEIVDLYIFDRKLRLLVTEAIERIEIALRARWTNRMTLAHGAHCHLNHELFNPGWKHAEMIAHAAKRASESRETFVEHYKRKYSDPYLPPLWVSTELMTFTELTKWYARTKDQSVKKEVAKDIGLPSFETMDGTLQLLGYIRNICAHHGRLWNRRTVKRLPKIKSPPMRSLFVQETNAKGQEESANTMYNALAMIVFLMKKQSGSTTFPARLANLVRSRNGEQLQAMGFPDDWQAREPWVTGA